MRGPPDAIGLVVLLVTGAAGASTGTTRAASTGTTQAVMSTTGVMQTTTASGGKGMQADVLINGTGTGSNGGDPYNGLNRLSFSGAAYMGEKTDVVPQAQPQPAGLGTTTAAPMTSTPPPFVNCSGQIYNGTACPDGGAKGLSVLMIIIIVVCSTVGAAGLAVLIWFLVTKYGPKAPKKAEYAPLINHPPDKPAEPGPTAIKVIPVNLVAHMHPPVGPWQ